MDLIQKTPNDAMEYFREHSHLDGARWFEQINHPPSSKLSVTDKSCVKPQRTWNECDGEWKKKMMRILPVLR